MNGTSNALNKRRIARGTVMTVLAILAVVTIVTSLGGCSVFSQKPRGVVYQDEDGNQRVYNSDRAGPKRSNKSLCDPSCV